MVEMDIMAEQESKERSIAQVIIAGIAPGKWKENYNPMQIS
jgi:hypothetical protein